MPREKLLAAKKATLEKGYASVQVIIRGKGEGEGVVADGGCVCVLAWAHIKCETVT